MKYFDFLDRIVETGLSAARRDYAKDVPKLTGSVAGFEACRRLHPGDLALLLEEARGKQKDAHERSRRGAPIAEYWRARCFCAEIEWVCNVVGAAFHVTSLRRKIELPEPFAEWRQPPVQISNRGQMTAMNLLL